MVDELTLGPLAKSKGEGMSDLNFDPRPGHRPPPKQWWASNLLTILFGWLVGVGLAVGVVVLRFNDLDDASDLVDADKIVVAIFGCTAILVLTMLAGIAVYVNRDRLGER